MLKNLLNVVLGIFIGILSMAGYEWITQVDLNKVVAYLPYANDYFYPNGKTYKGATPNPINNMPRDIDSRDPIPLNVNMGDQKLTIGVKNLNSKTIEMLGYSLNFLMNLY